MFRRSGSESDKFPVIFPLGIMMLVLGVLSQFCYVTRQSNIVAALVIGLVVGGMGWDHDMDLSAEIVSSFIELGNVLVLFFAGLSADYSTFPLYWKQIFSVSAFQFFVYMGTFAGIGIGAGICKNAVSACFFGLACSMSSTIMVRACLVRIGAHNEIHGKILRGVMLVQDTVAACSFAIIEAFARIKREEVPTKPIPSYQNSSMADLYYMDMAGVEIGRAVGVLFALIAVLAILNLFFLEKIFKLYRKESDMLFIGSMAYCFGISSLCFLAGFSPIAGAFFAGLSLAFLPTRSHIESKIASLRGFGMINFYFMLGIYLHLDAESLRRMAPWSILITALVVFIMPAFWVFSTRLVNLRGRTRFYIACISNSMGEISLIIQVLAYYAKIFDHDTHLVLIMASIWSMVLTTISQKYKHEIYSAVGSWYTVDSNSAEKVEREYHFESDKHIVILGFNEIAKEIADCFRQLDKEVAVIDLDPELCKALLNVYTQNKARDPSLHAMLEFRTSSGNGAANLKIGDLLELRKGTNPGGASPGPQTESLGRGVSDGLRIVSSSPDSVTIAIEGDSNGQKSPSAASFGGTFSRPRRRNKIRKSVSAMCTNVLPIYSDPQKPIIWRRYKLDQALLVISCLGEKDLNGLSSFLRENNVPFISTANKRARVKRKFGSDCAYLIHEDYLAAREFGRMLEEEMAKEKHECFKTAGENHSHELDEEDTLHSRSFGKYL